MVIPAAGSTRSGVGRASALHATTTPIWIKNRHQALQHGCFADQINQPLVPHDNHGHHLELGGSLYWWRSQTRDRNRARQVRSWFEGLLVYPLPSQPVCFHQDLTARAPSMRSYCRIIERMKCFDVFDPHKIDRMNFLTVPK